ncbi:MAG: SIS domain-containing protein [Spirochaetaceae bacterium]|nr:MAG: SIS domain-containing protein [Spirochaetaceae bacterium]
MDDRVTHAIGPRLRMRLPELTARERAILVHLLENADQAGHARITEIASRFCVSEALIVKLAKKLGYSGFKALKTNLQLYGLSSTSDLFEEVRAEDQPADILRKLFRVSIQALEETLAVIDFDEFRRAVDVFARAAGRDIYGVGGSAAIARDAAHKFLRIGIRCRVADDSHIMAMSASILHASDVVLAISHSGRTSAIIDAVRLARERKATVISLTSYAQSPLARETDICLVSTARSSPFTGENAAARIAQLNILDALFVCVAFRDAQRSNALLAQTMSAVENKRR